MHSSAEVPVLGNSGQGEPGAGSQFAAQPRPGAGAGTWPVRTGAVPPLADAFVPRPETGPGPVTALAPGRTVLLTAPAEAEPPGRTGGTGKTQLATYLAESLWQEHQIDLLVWVVASSRATVLTSYAQALSTMTGADQPGDAEAVAARLLAWLAQAGQPWLVVLDDLADPADLAGLWPEGPGGRVVITARDPAAVPDIPGALVAPVGGFSSHEALTYLMARLTADPDQRLGAVDLVEAVGGEPLALTQASATIMNSELTCRDYRELFDRRKDQLAAAASAEPAARSVTWTLSVEHADQLTPDGLAQPCLALAALLDSHGIPGSVFATKAACEYITSQSGGPPDPGRVRGALLSLERSGLLTIDPASAERTVWVHPFVQLAVRQAAPDSMREQAARAAASALLEAWPAEGTEPWLTGALRSSAGSLAEAAPGALWSDGNHAVLFHAGQSLDAARLTGAAVAHWQQLAVISERTLGPDHPDTAMASERLASASLAAGLGAEAVTLYQRAVDARTGTLGPDHSGTLAARGELGSALLAAGRPGDAIGVLEEVLNSRARQHGPDDLATLDVQDALAAAYQAAGRYPEAIRMGRRTLADRERRQGPDRPGTTGTRARLASACLAAGRPKDAVGHYKRVLTDRERALGPHHPATIGAVSDLAGAYHAARRLKEALPLYERALRDSERVQGTDHPDTLGARGNLASAYHSAGRMATALELYEQSRADTQRVLGAGHPDCLASRANLAHAYYAMGRSAEAIALLKGTLTDCERLLAPGDPLTVAVRDSLQAVSEG
jgi:tetratricopeptide (TPR) repeat protein